MDDESGYTWRSLSDGLWNGGLVAIGKNANHMIGWLRASRSEMYN